MPQQDNFTVSIKSSTSLRVGPAVATDKLQVFRVSSIAHAFHGEKIIGALNLADAAEFCAANDVLVRSIEWVGEIDFTEKALQALAATPNPNAQ